MLSPMGFHALFQQLARLIPSSDPARRLERKHERARLRHSGRGATDGCCGCCPACRGFVYVQFPAGSGVAPCPSCGRAIRELVPPGGPVGD